MAQLCVGTQSLVADCYGMKSKKAFVNSFLDMIRDRGAPTKLVSDCAAEEISQKAKEILQRKNRKDPESKEVVEAQYSQSLTPH